MKTVELTSGNVSYRYGNVLLTRKKPRATVSDAIAEAMVARGKVSEVTMATAEETPVVAAETSDDGTAVTSVSADVTSASAEEASTAEENAALQKVVAEISAARTKDALVTLAKKYGVDVSACKSNESRKAAILAAFE